jgi:4-diphosphocytidyl-2-C-methyl-D-erythritol kinase
LHLAETAYAKINLALHVRCRRDDGYHELETLFAFVDAGDRLIARSAAQDELRVTGEFAEQLSEPFGNIVAKALSLLPRADGLALTLEKNLPVAAGLGGGSADAGAVFRMVRDAYGLPSDWHQRAAKLGADVPACVESLACVGRGTGTELESLENDLSGIPILRRVGWAGSRLPSDRPRLYHCARRAKRSGGTGHRPLPAHRRRARPTAGHRRDDRAHERLRRDLLRPLR